jgi:branched-chain amino acid transport system permease protein
MNLDPVLIANACVSGLLLGSFYAIAAVGLTISFGLLDIVNIAHPALMVAAAFVISSLVGATALDPLFAALIVAPFFALFGAALYRVYHFFFERRGDESMRGLAFFFGLMFLIEVSLLLIWGADQQWTEAVYSSGVVSIGKVDFPLRMLIPSLGALATLAILFAFFKLTFVGRAVAAVAQDREALRLMGIDPVRINTIAFGLSIGLAALAGGALIVIQPVDSSSAQNLVGRLFALFIMGGLGSLAGSVIAGLLLLLGFLTLRPRGLLGTAT